MSPMEYGIAAVSQTARTRFSPFTLIRHNAPTAVHGHANIPTSRPIKRQTLSPDLNNTRPAVELRRKRAATLRSVRSVPPVNGTSVGQPFAGSDREQVVSHF